MSNGLWETPYPKFTIHLDQIGDFGFYFVNGTDLLLLQSNKGNVSKDERQDKGGFECEDVDCVASFSSCESN